jgi:hypothetical protein
MIKIIKDNPFRILGVYSNAGVKDILSNKNRMSKFAAVGKEVSFPNDFETLLGKIDRSEERINQASADLDLPKNKIKYALFWFINLTPIDNMALDYLISGDKQKCREILMKKNNFSSIINRAVRAFVLNQYKNAVNYICALIHTEQFRQDFVHTIAGDNFNISETELSQLFIDTLWEQDPNRGWYTVFISCPYVRDQDKNYLLSKLVSKPIKELEGLISSTKKTAGQNCRVRYQAGVKLKQSAEKLLPELEETLGFNNMKYTALCDSIAREILQCGIDYYNDTGEDDSLEKAYVLQSYATQIAKGSVIKQRCEENLKILNEIKQKLPPRGVRQYDRAINDKIAQWVINTPTCTKSIQLIKDCAPYLIKIKEVLGSNHAYYLQIGTLLSDITLNASIEEINKAIESHNEENISLYTLKNICSQACELLFCYIGGLPKSQDFIENRYNPNKDALSQTIFSLGIFINKSVKLDLRTEEEFWSDCKNRNTHFYYQQYITQYPNGKHILEAKAQYEKLKEIELRRQKEREAAERQKKLERQKEESLWAGCRSKSDYKYYLQKYPHGEHNYEAKQKIEERSIGNLIATGIGAIFAGIGILYWIAIIVTLIIGVVTCVGENI